MFILGPYKKILLLGGGELLRELVTWAVSSHYSINVLTSPRHSKEKINGETLEEYLSKNSISTLITENIKTAEVAEFVGDVEHVFCLSLGAAWIIPPAVRVEIFNDRLFNLHPTRLPINRGGGGWSWQILMGIRFGACTLHLMSDEVDTGDIVLTEEYLYPPTCRIPKDYAKIYLERSYKFVTGLLSETRDETKQVSLVRQESHVSTYWPRLDSSTHGWIDWSRKAFELERFICAFDEPYPGAKTVLNGKTVIVQSASLNTEDGLFHSYQSGLIYRKGNHWICIAAQGGALIVEKMTDENNGDMFESIQVGDRLFTPNDKLERAKDRVFYNALGLKTIGN